MTGVELAAAKLAFDSAQKFGLLDEIRTVASNTCKHKAKRKAAKIKAGELFIVAITYIHECPENQGFSKIAQWWFGMVLDVLVKWDRLDKNLAKEWTDLGVDIDRLRGADWYKIREKDGKFTRKSKVSDRRFYKIGRTSADVTKQAGKLLQIYTDYLKDKGYEPAQGRCEFPAMENMKEFICFHSRAETMGMIRNSIENHHFTLIYGEAGIGKTTMLVEIAKQIGHKFHKVVYVAVSRSPDIFQIQKKIARQLGVPLEDTNTDVADRAKTIERDINSTQDVLLVLDDVWRRLNLKQIGIQIPTGKNVKVLIGTRMRELPSHDGDDGKIPLGLLTGEDPWLFFKAAAGNVVEGSVAGPAEEIAEQCDGLPLALAVIGSTLSGSTNEVIWGSARDFLKKSEIRKVKDTNNETKVEELLCKVIEYSYEHLDSRTWKKENHDTYKIAMPEEDKIARAIFRLCCLFPENHDIPREDLKKYLTAENEKLESEDFDSAILRLSNWHLLQSSPDKGMLKMHDVVRAVALDIVKKEDSAFIASNIKELSEETVTSNKTVSVMGSCIEETDGFPKDRWYARIFPWKIGRKAECAKVQTLLLRGNTRLHELPFSFFERMENLAVLDLSESAITGLPTSMDKLKKVRTLVLNGCKDLKEVDMIANLWGLRILSLRDNALTSLPIGMKNLVNLLVLEFSPAGECDIKEGFFSDLPQLKELFLASAYLSDEAFKEIIELKKIESLRLFVYNKVLCSVEFVNKFENGEPSKWSEFTMFFRKVDNHPAQATAMVPAQALALATATATATDPVSTSTMISDLHYHPMSLKKKLHIEDIDTANEGVKLLLQEAEHLIIENCFVKNQGIHSNLTVATGVSKFTDTKILHLKDCGNIQYLNSGPSLQWAKLEVLELTGLEEFKGIFQGTVSAGSFNKVREITFRRCKKIDCVMPGNVVQKVHEKLQKITVIACDNVQSIFANYSGLFAALALIDVRGLVILATIWVGVPPQGTFAKLEELIVMDCKNLVFVFTTDLAAMLTSLQKLTVEENKGLKAIVQWDGHTALDKKVFPRVTHLSMRKLGGLKHFHGMPRDIDLEWPSLVQLRLGGCDSLTRFPIGRGNAPHMTLVDVTSAADEGSTWYKQLEKLKKQKNDAYKRELEELGKNAENKKKQSIIPPFLIRVKGVAVPPGV